MSKQGLIKSCLGAYVLFVLTYLLVRQHNGDGDESTSGREVTRCESSQLTSADSSEPKPGERVDALDLRDKTLRRINQIVTQYRPDIDARLSSLASREAPADDPEVIQLARDIIDPVPATVALGMKRSHADVVKTPQAAEVEKIINGTKSAGFFVECGALDGERSSNTIWLEEKFRWTGLLVEMDPFFYTQILGKNRRVHTANACLSPYTHISTLPFRGHWSGQGRLLYSSENGKKNVSKKQASRSQTLVPCFPLESLMMALNRTRIDYFSLDVEGAELDVLKTIPWDRLDIRILSVEYAHVSTGKEGLAAFMKDKGYTIFADIHTASPIYAFDYIFVKNLAEVL